MDTTHGYENVVIKEEIILPDEQSQDGFYENYYYQEEVNERLLPFEQIIKKENFEDESSPYTPYMVKIHNVVNFCEISSSKQTSNELENLKKTKKGLWCRKCKLRLPNLTEFQNHECTKYTCDICKKSFSYKSKLIPHFQMHSGLKPFQCGYCNKDFFSKFSLSRHTRKHTGEKPYQCPKCDRRFTQSGILNRHIMTHTDEKPHQCMECGKRFTRFHSMKRHSLRHAGIKPYACDMCGKKFTRVFGLRIHKCKGKQ